MNPFTNATLFILNILEYSNFLAAYKLLTGTTGGNNNLSEDTWCVADLGYP